MASNVGMVCASVPELIKDINPVLDRSLDELCSDVVELDDKIIFCGNTPATGREVWVSAGTPETTFVLNEVFPGSRSTFIDEIVEFNGAIYYFAETDLYRTDGTVVGTEILESYDSLGRGGFLEFGGELFFNGSSSALSEGFRKIDAAGNVVGITDKFVSSSIELREALEFNSKLYLAGISSAVGNELWVTEGTDATSILLKDIFSGASSSNPTELVGADNYFVFKAVETGNSRSLWASDGTSLGTVRLTDPAQITLNNQCSGESAALGSLVLFCADGGNDIGAELYVTDGTAIGTSLLKSINPAGADAAPKSITQVGDKVFFFAQGVSGDRQLWASDGSSEGTVQLTTDSNNSKQLVLMVKDDALFFIDETDNLGVALWMVDAATLTRALVLDFDPDSDAHGSFTGGTQRLFDSSGGIAYFQPDISDDVFELFTWRTDGTAAGTFAIRDNDVLGMIEPDGSRSRPERLKITGGKAYFSSPSPEDSRIRRIVISDESITEIFIELTPFDDFPNRGTLFSQLVNFDDALYFTAAGSSSLDSALWKTDGTAIGTTMVVEPDDFSCTRNSTQLKAAGEFLFMLCGNGEELWRTDGTASGTIKLANVGRVFFDQNANRLTTVGNRVVMVGYDSTNGRELWVSDGTVPGTGLLADIKPGSDGAFISEDGDQVDQLGSFAVLGDWVYFAADDGARGPELWRSNPATGVTELVKDIFALAGIGSFVQDITRIGDKLYFAAFTLDGGYELYVSDGTASGTRLVKDIESGAILNGQFPLSSVPIGYRELNGEAIFAAYNVDFGYELWRSNGTLSGTSLLADLETGPGSSLDIERPPEDGDFQTNFPLLERLRQGAVVDGKLLFVANPAGSQLELWRTDGTSAGTEKVSTLDADNFGVRNAQNFVVGGVNDSLGFFSAPVEGQGQTIWEYSALSGEANQIEFGSFMDIRSADQLAVLNGKLIFTADSRLEKGVELYALDIDTDRDGVIDVNDNCGLDVNSDQTNTDEDDQGNACDPDDDGDGVDDLQDLFPLDSSESRDNDLDGIGDNADPDDDNDMINDFNVNGEPLDNCQFVANFDQADTNKNGVGDLCDDAELCLPVKTQANTVVLICL